MRAKPKFNRRINDNWWKNPRDSKQPDNRPRLVKALEKLNEYRKTTIKEEKDTVTIVRRGKKRIFSWRSFLRKRHWLPGGRKRWRVTTLSRAARKLRRAGFHKARRGWVFITVRRLNVFLTLSRKRKNMVYKKSSTGMLNFKGKRKFGDIARQTQATKFFRLLTRRHFRILDVYCYRMGRVYRLILEQFLGWRVVVRFVCRKKRKIHGMLRAKKRQRK